MASRDDNSMPVLYGVSHVDGTTRVQIKFTANGYMLTDNTTTIQFDPSIRVSQTDNDNPLAMATSSDDDETVMPWVVNANTGAVLIS